MILCIVQFAGAGKSSVALSFKKKGFKVVEMGDILKGRMLKEGMTLDKRNVREYSLSIRKKYGKDVVAKMTAKEIKSKKGNIAITGMRSTFELEYFRKKLGIAGVVAVMAPDTVRFNRLHGRGKPDDPETLEDFRWTEQRELQGYMKSKKEVSHGLGAIINGADYYIYNTGTLADLNKNVAELIKDIAGKKAAK